MNKEKMKIAKAVFILAAVVTLCALAFNVTYYYNAISSGSVQYIFDLSRTDIKVSELFVPMLIFDILSAFLWFSCAYNVLCAIPVKDDTENDKGGKQ